MNTYLSQTGNYFQSYIRRGLSNLAAEDSELAAVEAAAATAAAASMVTPPNVDYQSFPSTTIHTTPIPEQYNHQERSSFESPQHSRPDPRLSIHAGGKYIK